MGFVLYGVDPVDVDGKVGTYFRQNVWGWRPLWGLTVETCSHILTVKDAISGGGNRGHRIAKSKAIRMAKCLQKAIDNGEIANTIKAEQKQLEEMADEICTWCDGTGTRDDKFVQGKCNVCDGRGKNRPFDTYYSTSVEEVAEFAEFCVNSGGFDIW
mgnify:FL=1|jgi:DnaJ-class molecular chaperone